MSRKCSQFSWYNEVPNLRVVHIEWTETLSCKVSKQARVYIARQVCEYGLLTYFIDS